MPSTTTDTAPSTDQVVHFLARSMYLAHASSRGWTPNAYPYVDPGSIRNARIAVDLLGFEDSLQLGASD